jgi:hypothetical protein
MLKCPPVGVPVIVIVCTSATSVVGCVTSVVPSQLRIAEAPSQ